MYSALRYTPALVDSAKLGMSHQYKTGAFILNGPLLEAGVIVKSVSGL